MAEIKELKMAFRPLSDDDSSDESGLPPETEEVLEGDLEEEDEDEEEGSE